MPLIITQGYQEIKEKEIQQSAAAGLKPGT